MATPGSPGAHSGEWTRRLGWLVGLAAFLGLVAWGPLASAWRNVSTPHAAPSARPSPAPTLRPAAPRELRVPSLHVVARVVPIAVGADRVLLPPRHPSQVGWWSASARPGDRRGATVIAGHTVHTGGGALDRLDQVRRGTELELRTASGRAYFRVDSVRSYRKAELARHAAQIFGQDVPARLVVVTCDDWNGREYLSNVVVTAQPARVVPDPTPHSTPRPAADPE